MPWSNWAAGSLFSWMVKSGWLKGNPVALAFEAIAATQNPLKRARNHFMLSPFYLTGLRTFEATAVDRSTLRRSLGGQR
jgi:site-specific recombinase XerD